MKQGFTRKGRMEYMEEWWRWREVKAPEMAPPEKGPQINVPAL